MTFPGRGQRFGVMAGRTRNLLHNAKFQLRIVLWALGGATRHAMRFNTPLRPRYGQRMSRSGASGVIPCLSRFGLSGSIPLGADR